MSDEKSLRELDAEMHKLMGWVYDPSRRAWHLNGYWTAAPDNYTNDPAASMMVLEKCLAKTTHIEIDFEDGVYRIMEAHEATLPLAICRFAQQLTSRK